MPKPYIYSLSLIVLAAGCRQQTVCELKPNKPYAGYALLISQRLTQDGITDAQIFPLCAVDTGHILDVLPRLSTGTWVNLPDIDIARASMSTRYRPTILYVHNNTKNWLPRRQLQRYVLPVYIRLEPEDTPRKLRADTYILDTETGLFRTKIWRNGMRIQELRGI